MTPPLVAIPPGVELQFSAMAVWSDGTVEDISIQVTWTSSDPIIAKIDAAGLATGVNPGTVTIGAEVCNMSSTAGLIVTSVDPVSFLIVPASPQVVTLGNTVTFACEKMTWTNGSETDCLGPVTWQATPAGVVSFTGNLAQGIAIGTATVSASMGSFIASSNSVPVEVTPAILQGLSVHPSTMQSLPVGTSVVFTAEGTYSDGGNHDVSHQVSWLADPPGAIVFENNVAHGISVGNADVSASLSGVTSNVVPVDVTPAVLTSIAIEPSSFQHLILGDTVAFSATGKWTDGVQQDITSQVSWTATPFGVVSFSGNVAQCVAAGDVDVSAFLSGVTSNTVPLKISASGFQCIR